MSSKENEKKSSHLNLDAGESAPPSHVALFTHYLKENWKMILSEVVVTGITMYVKHRSKIKIKKG